MEHCHQEYSRTEAACYYVGYVTGGSAASSSSCGSGSTASSCYDAGYQNALANPGKTCPTGHSYDYCAGWAHAREKRQTSF
ncbi:MAG TPA: hypothetical protein VEH06_01415 [Candidatus Bathyarchaeia archaeon]|jgi:hypothetical protein|nr:hypothetical protein [Candidatus Bathyarchaeia archaeon]